MFIHKLTALPSPGSDFFKKYMLRLTKFIWGERIPQISYNKFVQDYENMGLELIDLNLKETALKASWVAKLYEADDSEYSWLVL